MGCYMPVPDRKPIATAFSVACAVLITLLGAGSSTAKDTDSATGTTVSAETGRVLLGMAGKRRYAVYLHNQGGRNATVKLRFLAYGQVVHETSLDYTPGQ